MSLFYIVHPRDVTLLHCPSSFSSDGLDVDLPLSCPGEQSCTELPPSIMPWRTVLHRVTSLYHALENSLVQSDLPLSCPGEQSCTE
ncbi:hypothetical protein DPMN_018197 [Dreissena polymorpha]|uniref:Uncharacterized protein n=1 Tax=Dreissena polymorpha TaxID=45954 RepID=A0A9D4NGQ0_DREPO|nr:hypothetical protein DPMN_018197 [Dreissena polymorpha]